MEAANFGLEAAVAIEDDFAKPATTELDRALADIRPIEAKMKTLALSNRPLRRSFSLMRSDSRNPVTSRLSTEKDSSPVMAVRL
jgi:hypothetical protein